MKTVRCSVVRIPSAEKSEQKIGEWVGPFELCESINVPSEDVQNTLLMLSRKYPEGLVMTYDPFRVYTVFDGSELILFQHEDPNWPILEGEYSDGEIDPPPLPPEWEENYNDFVTMLGGKSIPPDEKYTVETFPISAQILERRRK